jgi:hypothetical protein
MRNAICLIVFLLCTALAGAADVQREGRVWVDSVSTDTVNVQERIYGTGWVNAVLGTIGITITTGTETQETGARFSHIETTSNTIKVMLDRDNDESGYKKFSLFSGDHATNPHWEFLQDGDVAYLWFLTNGSGSPYLQMGVDSNGPALGYGATGARTVWRYDGNPLNLLPSTDGSDEFRVVDSGVNEVFSVDSDGNVEMVAGAKLTQPDTGSTPGNNHLGIGAADNYLDHDSTSVTLGATRVYYTSDGGSTASAVFRVPMPAKLYGGTIILDRLYVYYEALGSGSGIDVIRLQTIDTNGYIVTDVVNHTDDLTDISEASEHQWLDSDYTMLTGPVAWRIRVDIKHLAAGTTYVNGFYVQWHEE